MTPLRFDPTHIVSLYGIRCYLNDETGDVAGVNWLYDRLIGPAVMFHNTMSALTAFVIPWFEPTGFPFKIIKRLKETP